VIGWYEEYIEKGIGMEIEPAEVFSLAEYISDELQARGWTTENAVIRMGVGSSDEFAKTLFELGLMLCVQRDNLHWRDKLLSKLASAFDVSEGFLRNLDTSWRKWPDRRSPFEPPECIFGPISRQSEALAALRGDTSPP
jgi:hypothetical protein